MHIKYNDFVEVLYSKSMVLNAWMVQFLIRVSNSVIIDVLNSQLLVKKWNGRVFNKGELMVNPDVFLNLFKTGRIIDYRKVFKE